MSDEKRNRYERNRQIARITADVGEFFNTYKRAVLPAGQENEIIKTICAHSGCSRQAAWKHYQQWLSGVTPRHGGAGRGQGRPKGSKNKPKETE